MVARSDIRQVSPFVYEISQDYRGDMRTAARLYADEEILEKALEDRSLDQLVNTATLPGVVGYAMAMPDIHQGYGFPIGGVVATSTADGVVSPGGVGYDINCLAGDSQVLSALGYTRPIAEYEADWSQQAIACHALGDNRAAVTPITRFLRQAPRAPVLRVETASGHTVVATADHPFWTPDGMIPLGQLQVGDRVATVGFEGVPYETPSDEPILTRADVEATLMRLGKGQAGNALAQAMSHLEKLGLLPLRYSSPALPYLLRLMGVVWGDGTAMLKAESKGTLTCYGRVEDLEDVQDDIRAIGFQPSRVYARTRRHAIQTTYRAYTFENVETWIKVSSTALVGLLAAMGLPLGSKARSDWRLPDWIKAAPAWQKRLFLGALCGAEMNAPGTITEHDYNFEAPILSVNKRAGFVESGVAWLTDIAGVLADLGVATLPISQRAEQVNADGWRSIRLRLAVSTTPENLIRLWSRVGFECHREKRALASVAVIYLRRKQQVIEEREAVAAQAIAMRVAHPNLPPFPPSLKGGGNAGPPPSLLGKGAGGLGQKQDRPSAVVVLGKGGGGLGQPFAIFREGATAGLDRSGMAWDPITSLAPLPDFTGDVYDFTVAHEDHNFVANGFVVSNCGVRLLSSRLSQEEVTPYLDDLATAVQRFIPSGVGESGFVRLNADELSQVLEQGARWALRRGFARAEDLEHTEENGCIAGADASKCSSRAKERGRDQVGTLGAGNHFCEIDVVEEVFDAEAADAFGLAPGQVCVQIHCGSRGFGHQICTDYVNQFQKAMRKYKIELPDRELVSVPVNSPEGQDYLAAMKAAANYAWANRQLLAHQCREAFSEVLNRKVRDANLYQVYDIAHNMAKIEEHDVAGKRLQVCVHRKGATRAFGPGSLVIPRDYREVGQPVLVPGSMGTASWVLAGTLQSMRQTFGSTCHGAGRTMSRAQAKREVRGDQLRQDMEADGIHVRAGSMAGLAEEAPSAYKDVDRVVEVVDAAGIARKVARLRPLAVVKG